MGTVIVGAIVFAGIGFAGYSTYKSKKSGDSCGCGCAGCDKANSKGCN